MNKIIKHLIFALFVFLSFVVEGQNNGALRVELDAKKNAETYNIVPIGEQGVIVFYESDERDSGGNKLWFFTKYNTVFKEVWTKEFPVVRSMNFLEYDYSGGKTLYLLLQNAQDFQILQLDVVLGNITSKFSKPIDNYTVDNFKVLNHNAFILGETEPTFLERCGQVCFTYTCIPIFTGATVYKENGVVQNVDLTGGKNQGLYVNPKGKSSIIGAEKEDEKFLNVLVRKIPHRKFSQTFKYRYSADGNLLSTSEIKTDTDKEILSGRINYYDDKSEILIGSYAKVSHGKRKRLRLGAANGLYFCVFQDNAQKFIKYHDFTQFKSFHENLRTGLFGLREGAKVTEEGGIGYRLLVHDIIVRGNEYIMIAEAYYPEYHTETYWTTDANGRSVMRTRQVFDGWRYTNAIIAGFSNTGELLWDNTFEMGDILSFDLKERVKVLMNDDEIAMLYSWGGDVQSKIISGSEVVEGKTKTKIDTKNQDDMVRRNYGSDVVYWYGNYFISYGYQTIKSDEEKDNKGKRKRTVFYFNKIGYQ